MPESIPLCYHLPFEDVVERSVFRHLWKLEVAPTESGHFAVWGEPFNPYQALYVAHSDEVQHEFVLKLLAAGFHAYVVQQEYLHRGRVKIACGLKLSIGRLIVTLQDDIASIELGERRAERRGYPKRLLFAEATHAALSIVDGAEIAAAFNGFLFPTRRRRTPFDRSRGVLPFSDVIEVSPGSRLNDDRGIDDSTQLPTFVSGEPPRRIDGLVFSWAEPVDHHLGAYHPTPQGRQRVSGEMSRDEAATLCELLQPAAVNLNWCGPEPYGTFTAFAEAFTDPQPACDRAIEQLSALGYQPTIVSKHIDELDRFVAVRCHNLSLSIMFSATSVTFLVPIDDDYPYEQRYGEESRTFDLFPGGVEHACTIALAIARIAKVDSITVDTINALLPALPPRQSHQEPEHWK